MRTPKLHFQGNSRSRGTGTHACDYLGYQETLQELLALQAYVAELQSQTTSLDDVMLDLTLEQAYLRNPELLLAS